MSEEAEKSFSDILVPKLGDIKEPKRFPQGTWRLKITNGKLSKRSADADDNMPIAKANFGLVPVEPGDDVAPAELEATGDWKQLQGFHRIAVFTDAEYWNVVKFLQMIGYDMSDPDKPLDVAVAETKGYQFTAFVRHGHNKKDPERPFVNFTNIQAAA